MHAESLLLILFIAAMFWAAFWQHDAIRAIRRAEDAEARAEKAERRNELCPFGDGDWPS